VDGEVGSVSMTAMVEGCARCPDHADAEDWWSWSMPKKTKPPEDSDDLCPV